MVASFINGVAALGAAPPVCVSVEGAAALTERERAEALALLGGRPVHNVSLAGALRDHGVVSEHHRGTFHGYRDAAGRLEGVALVGHHTLFEARTRRALTEFARLARGCARAHVVMGEVEAVGEFWDAYAGRGRGRRAWRGILFELQRPALGGLSRLMVEPFGPDGLRPATFADVELIAPAHAAMAAAAGGVNPLATDPRGFVGRYLRRIRRGRTWVVTDAGRLVFKADVQAETPEAAYLEGVYLSPEARGAGLGRRYLEQLCRRLHARSRVVCLLAGNEDERAQRLYRACGFRPRSVYDAIFLRRD